jgi:hypothetical protein
MEETGNQSGGSKGHKPTAPSLAGNKRKSNIKDLNY